MLRINKGFDVDIVNSSMYIDAIIINGGQIFDASKGLIYVRNGFNIPKEDGVFYVYYNPLTNTPNIEISEQESVNEVYIGEFTINGSSVSITQPNIPNRPINFIVSESGVVHSETVVVDGMGKITTLGLPKVIIEIYVDGYGFLDIHDGVSIENNKINLGTTELTNKEVRVVYET